MLLETSASCVLHISFLLQAHALAEPLPLAPGAASAGGALTAVLGLDDACRCTWEGSCLLVGDDALSHCALGAVQHSMHARLASVMMAPKPLKTHRLSLSHSEALRVDAEDSLIILAAHYFGGHRVSAPHPNGVFDIGMNDSLSASMMPGVQFPRRGKGPAGWKYSQERWVVQGDAMPSWADIPNVSVRDLAGHERATLLAPVLAVSLTVLCILTLVVTKNVLARMERHELAELDLKEGAKQVMDEEALKPNEKDRVKMKSEEVKMKSEEAVQQASSEPPDSRLPMNTTEKPDDNEAPVSTRSTKTLSTSIFNGLKEEDFSPIWFHEMFRFATVWDKCMIGMAVICACVHGFLMPLAFYHIDGVFRCIYLPNDDGSLPPIKGPHAQRDAAVWEIAKIYLCTALAVGVGRCGSVVLMSQSSRRQTYRCRMKIFETLLRRGPAWHDLQDTSEMASRVSQDTFFFKQGIDEKPLDCLRSSLVTIMSLVMAAHKNWKLAIIMSITMPISIYAMTISMSIVEASGTVIYHLYAKAGAIAETACRLVRTVFAFNGQAKELSRYQDRLLVAQGLGNRIGLVAGFCAGVNSALSAFALSMGVYAGSVWILESYERECWLSSPPFGTCLTGGSIMGTIYCVQWGFTMGLSTLPASLESITNAKTAARRIFAIIDDLSTLQSQSGQELERAWGHLSFESVVFSYPGRQGCSALRGITLAIPPGSTYALVGPSGSGKSTVVNLILRFYEPTSGRILFDGHDTQGLDTMWMRSKMALVEQEPPLFRGTISENISYGSVQDQVDEAEVHRAAEMANAHDFITKLPLGYRTEVGDRGVQLSGGQKQRIAIARSLIRDPTFMILDEATSALDSASEKMVQDALNKLMQGRSRTMIIIAHRLTTIQNADHICVLEKGNLVEQGSHCSLLAKKGLYWKLIQSQVEALMLEDEKAGENQLTNQEKPSAKDGGDSQNVLPESFRADSACSDSIVPILPAQRLKELEVEASAAAELPQAEQLSNAFKVELELVETNWQTRVWEESRPEYNLYCLGIFFIAFTSCLMPWYMMRFAQVLNLFNRPPVVLMPDTKDVWAIDFDEAEISAAVSSLCLIMQCCGVLMVFTYVGAYYSFNRAAEALTGRLRVKAFSAMMRQDIPWHDEHPPGTLASRLSEQVPRIKMLVGHNLAAGCQACLGVLFGLGLAFIFSWKYTLCVLGAVPIIALGALLLSWAKFDNENLFGGMVSESLCSIKTVAAFNLEKKLMVHFRSHLDVQGRKEHKAALLYGCGQGFVGGGIFLLMCVDLWFANIFVNRGEMSQDRALVVFFCVFAAATSTSQAFIWMGDRTIAIEAAQKFFALVDRKPLVDSMGSEGKQPAPKTGKHRGTKIEFEEICFCYPSRPDIQVFQDFSLTLEPNTTTALVGPSGSGKSTAVALLQRFYEAQSGSIRFNGEDIRDLNVSWLRSQMGLVQQEPVLFAGSILENIRYGCEGARDADIVNAARAANAHGFVCNLPEQYFTDVGNRGSQLSGGQKQRIAIARALVCNPSVFLLDEATAALDTASERQVQEALDELLKTNRHTTLIIAHRLTTIQGADQICVMNNGRLEQKGTHQELLKMDGLYSKLIGRQQHLDGNAEPSKTPAPH